MTFVMAITGNRYPTEEDERLITDKMKQAVAMASEIRFGGARGVDTVALKNALEIRKDPEKRVKLSVILPNTLMEQPKETLEITKQADEIIELKKEGPERFQIQKSKMVKDSDLVYAFWNGETSTETHLTITIARKMGIPVKVYRIEGGD